jgi:hypothetical protein
VPVTYVPAEKIAAQATERETTNDKKNESLWYGVARDFFESVRRRNRQAPPGAARRRTEPSVVAETMLNLAMATDTGQQPNTRRLAVDPGPFRTR